MNFCFWAEKGKQKWMIHIDGGQLDGSVALFRAIEEEAYRNPKFLDPSCILKLEYKKFKKILSGNIEISLIKCRYENLRITAKILEERYGSDIRVF